MAKSINLAKVSLSPKWILWAIVGFILLIAVWKVASWAFDKISGATSGVVGGFTSV
jgi:hypothetical protein